MLDTQKYIVVRGAREHNLKNVDIDIPRGKFVVFTGVSGSGKSSLAFDTLYAEGQRRYVESLSAYARQFLQLMQKPDVDQIEGLSPAIAIEQKTTSRNPRSTVATVTEIYDYLRLLFARCGTPFSPATGKPIASMTVTAMVDRILLLPDKSKFLLMAPIARHRKGTFRKEIADLIQKGFQRIRIDGDIYEIEDVPALKKNLWHDIEVIVDRLVIRPDLGSRLAESLETALRLGDGIAQIESPDDPPSFEPLLLSEKFACPVSGFTISEIEPRLFSFNSPQGACSDCDGIGVKRQVDPARVIPDVHLSIGNGAIAPWSRTTSAILSQTLDALSRAFNFSLDTAWSELPDAVHQLILFGSGKEKISFVFQDGKRRYESRRTFEGVITSLRRRHRDTDSNWVREDVERYMSSTDCEACQGFRLRSEARAVKLSGMHIAEVCALSIREAVDWIQALPGQMDEKGRVIGKLVIQEIENRLRFLADVGLDYLRLSRNSGTLSGGEGQRIRLASQIGSGLTGVMYVLDEPSVGLHQRDNTRLLETLIRLRDLGNTVIVVEHDEDAIRSANYIVDVGPRAGVLGGQVIATGNAEDIMACTESLTGKYLSGRLRVFDKEKSRQIDPKRALAIFGARRHNLKGVDVSFPLGTLCCVTGVSGSGKSTLVLETLYKALSRELHKARELPGEYERIEGLDQLDKVIVIDQSPIGRTPRSNPATYTGVFTPVREWFSGLPESKARGYQAGRYSFNVKGGRCEACKGDGVMRIEMHFLPDVHVSCEQCRGRRYNRETLEVTYRDHSIADVLNLTVDEGVELFKAVPAIRGRLETLQSVGLGYIGIGQSATTLSGGEAQRIKLSRELSRRATGRTLYILDEPTTGLHFDDVARLILVLEELVDQGNTVIVIEHNLDVVACADWIVDLGPEGGDAGGQIVCCGRPKEVMDCLNSHTGIFLRKNADRRAEDLENLKNNSAKNSKDENAEGTPSNG